MGDRHGEGGHGKMGMGYGDEHGDRVRGVVGMGDRGDGGCGLWRWTIGVGVWGFGSVACSAMGMGGVGGGMMGTGHGGDVGLWGWRA